MFFFLQIASCWRLALIFLQRPLRQMFSEFKRPICRDPGMFLMIKSHDMANRNGYNWSCLSGKNPKPQAFWCHRVLYCISAALFHRPKKWCSNDDMHTFKLNHNYIILIKHAARHTHKCRAHNYIRVYYIYIYIFVRYDGIFLHMAHAHTHTHIYTLSHIYYVNIYIS